MRDFKQLDPYALRAFYFASESASFSEAARKANLTQSGISQHVAHLEKALGVDLFLRTGKRVSISPQGKRLKSYVENYLDGVEQVLDQLSGEVSQQKGLVRYAMPNSCLMTPHFSMLLEKREKFEKIDLKVNICPSEEVIREVLEGEADFGFVTRRIESPHLSYEVFAHEEYVLAGRPGMITSMRDIHAWQNANFIRYPGMDVLFESWKAAYFSKAKLSFENLKFRGEISHLSGAITMASHGVGLGIFPKHCISEQIQSKKLAVFPDRASETSSGKGLALFPIHIVRRLDTVLPARVKRVMDAFFEMIKKD